MQTVTSNTPQQINSALFALDKSIKELDTAINVIEKALKENDATLLGKINEKVNKADVVDAVTDGDLNPVTSNAVANYVVDRIEANNTNPVTSNAVAGVPYNKFQRLPENSDLNTCTDTSIIYFNSSTADVETFANKPTFTASGEMAVFSIPLGASEYLIQIYIAKAGENRSVAHRVCHSGVWSSWGKMLDTSDDDNSVVGIVVSANLGVSNVSVSKKGNLCYMQIVGTYTGAQTFATQTLCTGIPSRYTPSFNQTFGVVSYRNGTPAVLPSRIEVTNDGRILLDETAMGTGDNMRFGFCYILD